MKNLFRLFSLKRTLNSHKFHAPFTLLFVAGCLCFFNSLSAQEQWFPIGPSMILGGQHYGQGISGIEVSGRATVIAVNPFNSKDVWIGTANGGLWHSSNCGELEMSWKPMTDRLPSLAIGSIVLKDCDENRCRTVYIGTGEDNIRRDTYFGRGIYKGDWFLDEFFEGYSFSPLGDSETKFTYGSIVNLIVEGTDMYAAVSEGRTCSASQSTVKAPEPLGGYGIHHSSDNGLTWNLLGNQPNALPTDLVKIGTTLYAGFWGLGIYKLEIGTSNWCPINLGAPPVTGCSSFATGLPDPALETFYNIDIEVAPSDPQTMYAIFGKCFKVTSSGCKPDFYKTNNGGLSWTKATANSISNGSTGDNLESYSTYARTMKVHPTDPNTIIFGGLIVWKSSDSGENFTDLGTSSVHPDHQDLVYADPSNPDLIYNVNDGGFYYSKDGGQCWFNGNYDLQITGFYSVGADVVQETGVLSTPSIIGGAQDNGTNAFNGSKVWVHIYDGDGGDCFVQDARNIYASAQKKSPQQSTNGGASFRQISSGLSGQEAFYPPYLQHPLSNNIYFATNKLFKYNSPLFNWDPVSPIFDPSTTIYPEIESINSISSVGLSASNENRVYVGFYNGAIWRSNNSGPCIMASCWEEIGGPNISGDGLPDAVVSSIDVHPTNSDRIYVTYSGFNLAGGNYVYRSINGGQTWSSISTGLPNISANVIRVNPEQPSHLWLGTDQGVYKSENNGSSWTSFERLGMPNVPVYDFAIDNFRGRIYAATHGRGMFMLTSNPVLTTHEGWMDGEIWDILLQGDAFEPSSSISSCNVEIILQDGTICASGNMDSYGDAEIRLNSEGSLVTDRPLRWEGRSVITACFNGKCVGGANIRDCLDPNNPITSIRVSCGGQVAFASISEECPQQASPPTTILEIDPPIGNTPNQNPFCTVNMPLYYYPEYQEDGSFDVIVQLASTSAAEGGDRILCGAKVSYKAGETPFDVASKIRKAINQSTQCAKESVVAQTPQIEEPNEVEQAEDFVRSRPTVMVSAPEITGGQLIVAIRTGPGESVGNAVTLRSLGSITLNQLGITRTTFTTKPGGAVGGEILFTQQSPLGVCQIAIETTAGQSGEDIAKKIQSTLLDMLSPGIQGCEARQNPYDAKREGASIITVIPHGLTISTTDPGVGFSSGSDGLDILGYEIEKPEYKLGLSAHLGLIQTLNKPSSIEDGGNLFEIDLEYRFNRHLSLEAVVGQYSFDPNNNILGGSVYLKPYLNKGKLRAYLAGGGGLYNPNFDQLSPGISFGAGLNLKLTDRFELDLGSNYFNIFTPETDDIDFLTAKFGAKYFFLK